MMSKFARRLLLYSCSLALVALAGCNKAEEELESKYRDLIVERWIVNQEYCDDMPVPITDNYRIYDFVDDTNVNRIFAGSINGLLTSTDVESGTYTIDGDRLICDLEDRYLDATIVSLSESELVITFNNTSVGGNTWRKVLVPSYY